MGKFTIRLACMLPSGLMAWEIAKRAVGADSSAFAHAHKFAGILLLGTSVFFAVFDLFFKTAAKSLEELEFTDDEWTATEKKALRDAVDSSRFSLNLTVATSLALKAISGVCGTLLVSDALKGEHFRSAAAVGYFTLGAAIPLLIFVYMTGRDFQRIQSQAQGLIEERKLRHAQLKKVRESPPHAFDNDEKLNRFGRLAGK